MLSQRRQWNQGNSGSSFQGKPSLLQDGLKTSVMKVAEVESSFCSGFHGEMSTPATGGVKIDGTTGTDLWNVSCSTSSYMYEMWRGNGVNTYDDNSVLLDSNHRVYGRKFSGGYVVFRMRATDDDTSLSKPKTFTMPFTFRKLRANNTLDKETNQLTLLQNEGAILITGTPPPPDTIPPVISNPLPSGVQSYDAESPADMVLTVNTDENATCKYGTSNVSYDSMPNSYQTTGAAYHLQVLSLACSVSYTYYTRCMDASGNKTLTSATHSFSIGKEVPVNIFLGIQAGGASFR